MPDLTYLILQILAVILPIFVYHTFFGERIIYKNSRVVSIYDFSFWFVALLLCMLLPTFLTTEYRFDLRTIPITLGFLYSGPVVGFALAFVSLVVRFFMGGLGGLYHYLLVLLFYLPVVLVVFKSFRHASPKIRMGVFIGLSLFPFVCSSLALLILADVSFLISSFNAGFFLYVTVCVIASWTAVLLLETIRENRQMRLSLQQAERQKLLRDLTSVFAHEIRNPMQVARGFLQFLNAPDLSTDKKKYIDLSIEELDRANGIISEFLAFAKPQKEEIEPIEVRTQLLRVIDMLQGYAQSQNVTIEADLPEHYPVLAHQQKLDQCLLNIFKNAIESMPDGGVVSVACSSVQPHCVTIDITDRGIGMTKEQINQLGSPFYSLKEKGTGIGLMVSYQIIESFHGKITVTSEKGIGTTFSIRLPISRDLSLSVANRATESM
ncbi:ATP-binding protein [Halalkalibacter lacteus]|uniref:ATP-binding protein n=1 Tax=Halalkalibacter lacteus TaxID=3090663 RepID=UPI002FC74263